VSQDISRIHDWGFDLIKHDFTTTEIFGRGNVPTLSWPGMLSPLDYPAVSEMYDKTRTNAQIIRDFYQAIQNAAKGSIVIGCNTIGHLVAGIHEVQRVGNDTSVRVYEYTVRNGVHSMMRMPQNETFFRLDADCAAFTEMVPTDLNLDFLESMAITGTATFASVTPGILNDKEAQRLADILKIAATIKPNEFATVEDWDRTSAPAEFMYKGELKTYEWWKFYDGSRLFSTFEY
jgi:alpha-galactosidase